MRIGIDTEMSACASAGEGIRILDLSLGKPGL